MIRERLFGKTIEELTAVAARLDLPSYTAAQIAGWLYKKNISSITEMSNIAVKTRSLLEEYYEYGLQEPVSQSESTDGTKKYLFRVLGTRFVETAYIPDRDRATICISTQSGCKMGCKFCMTGKQGFQGNLTSNEILNQFRSIPEHDNLTNIVFMGMGEPLDNREELFRSLSILTSPWGYGWSPTRITVSTVGLIGPVKEFLERTKCHLALSLHSPFDQERIGLMPIQRTNPLKEVLDTIRSFDMNRQRRISFEYILFEGINDTPAHIKELSRLLNGIRCRINLIRFHKIPGSEYSSPSMSHMEEFRDRLKAKGIMTTIRASRGEDIMAACGLLSTLEQNKKE
ncbi:MAG: 23S rRNA (adenine(2503)-C(2))-methyltransferase RlmN [Bacteroidales bacterium]|nr:23S rRNA (adenine(2503)-C(2))-methyltransferase RlmN [Bacteroidales bacterium]